MATDSVVVITGEGVLLALSVGASSAAQYPSVHRTVPTKNHLAPNASGAGVGKPCSWPDFP